MRPYTSRMTPPFTMIGGAVGVVEQSKNPEFPVGCTIVHTAGWVERGVVNPDKMGKASPSGKLGGVKKAVEMGNLSKSLLLGACGMPGNTAYFGLVVQKVYDSGSVFDPEILDITDDDLKAKFMSGVAQVAALSLAISYPTIASVPHSVVNGMKNLLAVAAVTDITFKEAEMLKEFLADPSKFAAAAAPAAAAAAAKAPEPESEEEDDDDDMGFGLFD